MPKTSKIKAHAPKAEKTRNKKKHTAGACPERFLVPNKREGRQEENISSLSRFNAFFCLELGFCCVVLASPSDHSRSSNMRVKHWCEMEPNQRESLTLSLENADRKCRIASSKNSEICVFCSSL